MLIRRFTTIALLALLVACGGGGGGSGGGGSGERGSPSTSGVNQPASPYAGTWQGTFGGTDSGSWEARVDQNGRITATGTSRQVGTFRATGTVSPAGEFSMTASGAANTGATFTGSISRDGIVSGGWTNARAGGSFSGRQITADNRLAGDQIVGSFRGFGSFQPNRVLSIPAGDAIQGNFATTAGRAVTGSFGFGTVSADLRLTTDGQAAPRAARLTSGGRQFDFDPATDGSRFIPGNPQINLLTWDRPSGGRNTFLVLAPSDLRSFEYLAFGFWQDAPVGGSTMLVGAGAFGAPTAASAVPRSARATYRGFLAGFFATSGRAPAVVDADVRLDVDFQRQRIDFSTRRTNAGTPQPLPELDMTGQLAINGARFSGTAATVTGLQGPIIGRFYGPGAVEAGGVFDVTRGATERLTGAFGTKRD